MHPAYSVILFTTASGAGYGLLMLLALVGLVHGPASSAWFGAAAMVLSLGLVTVGLLSSTFHLGRPERAWRAFSQWRTSWLSREGVLAVAVYPVALMFFAAWLFDGFLDGVLGLLGVMMACLALATVYCTGMIYASLATIRQWNHGLVTPIYIVFSLATGACLLLALAHLFGRGQPVQSAISLAFLCLVLVLKLAYWRSVDTSQGKYTMQQATGLGHLGPVRQWETPHTAENFVMKEMGYKVARAHARKLRSIAIGSLAFAAICTLVTFAGPSGVVTPAAILAAIFALSGAVVERWLFFAEAQHVVTLYYGAQRA